MEITRGQKKILITASVGAALFLIFWIFIYLPAKNSVSALKEEILQIENKISATTSIIGEEPLEKGLSTLQERLEALDRKLPDSEEETLRMISSTAHETGVNVISTKPQPKSIFLDRDKNMVRIGNKLCHRMPMSMHVSSSYNKLGRFLESLRKDVPSISTIEKLTLTKQPEQYELNANINLTIYLLCEGK